jgi:hypothetical protein
LRQTDLIYKKEVKPMTDEEKEELMKRIHEKVDRFSKLSPEEQDRQIHPSAGKIAGFRSMGEFVFPPGVRR